MKKLLVLLVSAFIIFSISSCSDDSTNPTIDGSQIFPLKTGNFWVYNTTGLDNQGTEIQAVDTLKVGDAITYGKMSAYKIYLNGYINQYYLVPQNTGIYAGVPSGDSLRTQLKYKYPCNRNDYYGDASATVQVIDTNQNVTIEFTNRLYKCVHYQTIVNNGNNEHTQIDEYLAVGVGVVKFVQTEFTAVHPEGLVVLTRDLYFYLLK